MLFSTVQFGIFFTIYFIFHLLIPYSWRIWMIIVGSAVFYGWWKPAYTWLPFALTFIAGAAQRRCQALGRVHQLGIAVYLGAGKPGSERLLRVALDPGDPPILDMGQQRAHVGTIMCADDPDLFQRHLHLTTAIYPGISLHSGIYAIILHL